MKKERYTLTEERVMGVKCVFVGGNGMSNNSSEEGSPSLSSVLAPFHDLKALSHINLCCYIDILRGTHERVYIVSEHYRHNLATLLKNNNGGIAGDVIGKYAFQILRAIVYLSNHGIIHNNLSPDTILLDEKDNIKLADYGFYHLMCGRRSLFAYGDPRYMAVEAIAKGAEYGPHHPCNPKSVLWSLGVILWELAENKHPFINATDGATLTPQQILVDVYQKVRGLTSSGDESLDEILRTFPKDLDLDVNMVEDATNGTDPDGAKNQERTGFSGLDFLLRDFICRCLVWNPKHRVTPEELLHHPYFYRFYKNGELPLTKHDTLEWVRKPYLKSLFLPDCSTLNKKNEKKKEKHEESFTWEEIYNFWRLSGGDPETEMYKVTKPSPAINNLPLLVTLDKFTDLYHSNFLADLHAAANDVLDSDDDALDVSLLLDEEIHVISLDSLQEKFETFSPTANSMSQQPVTVREQDLDYQRRRLRIFRSILEKFEKEAPEAEQQLLANTSIDIPPIIRADIWAALLGVRGTRYFSEYSAIDTESDGVADKQIDLDIPRCHQYHPLLASPQGHAKLKRVLKAWVQANPDLAYWQGLDSTLSPFLTLNFSDEARAFACLQKFMQKYLRNFYARDNALALQEYLIIFRQVLAYHDPQLATHLHDIDFQPDLYAIPWFLTAFTRPDILPLFMAISIMGQLRSTLLTTDFNSAIHVFSNLPSIDIWECIKDTYSKYSITPLSTTIGRYTTQEGPHWWEKRCPLKDMRKELATRIATHDLVTAKASGIQLVVLDTRVIEEYSKVRYPESIHVDIKDTQHMQQLEQYRGTRLVVVGSREDAHQFASQLIMAYFPYVSVLNGGIDALLVSADPLLEYEM